MLKPNVHVILRLLAGTAVVVALAVSPQLAQAQAPGSLTQLGVPNNCVQVASESNECSTTGTGLAGTGKVAVSPDGQNVYVLGSSDDAIAEFTRNADGSLTQLPSPNDCIADTSSDGSCPHATATGLVNPQGIVVSPDGHNVYVVGRDANNVGTIAEFARNADGSLTQLSPNACIGENTAQTDGTLSDCANQSGHGIEGPTAVAISPDGQNVYVADDNGESVAEFTRTAGGSLTQLNGANDCITESGDDNSDCTTTAEGLTGAFDVAVSPDGGNVYVASTGSGEEATIAEFARASDGSLTQLASPNNCVEEQGSDQGCGTDVLGLNGFIGLALSPDGQNLYSASQFVGGPIAEFARNADGSLTQLAAPNNCIEEVGGDEGCGTQANGIASGFDLQVSPDGASVYAAAPNEECGSNCQDVAEFARNPDGSLTQLASPDNCIQEHTAENSESPECGNENGHGLGGPALAISPDGASVYVAGPSDIAEFSRTPVTHTLTVSLAGSGGGVVSDQTGAIHCQPTCSNAYTANSKVTLTATPDNGSTFTGWGGACSGTGSCQVTMNADMAVSATFTANPGPPTPPTPGAPTPVVTGAPSAVTDFGAGFTASVNPDGLPTTVYFQYGLDKRYTQLGGSGPNYTLQTPGQVIGSDFATHGVGPVTVSGLVPNALYHVRVIATNSAGTTVGQDVTFMTQLAPFPGPPTLGQTFNVAPVSGLIFILIHGQLVPLTQLEQIGPNTIIDSRLGTLLLITAAGDGQGARDAAAKGKTQSGKFGGAVFRVHQALGTADRGLTTLMMLESAFKGAPSQAICKAPAGDAHATALSSKTIQLLHASAHGKFSTSGRYSAATVRGTVWTIIARCDGTLVRDIHDSVVVRDFIRHKTIVLHAGQSYFTPGPGRK